MASIAKIQIIGNLGSVEQREITSKKTGEILQVICFTLAVNFKKDNVKHVNWYTVETWNPNMKLKFFTKGKQIYVDGTMRLEQFTTQDGIEKIVPKIYASSILFLGKREPKEVIPSPQPKQTGTKKVQDTATKKPEKKENKKQEVDNKIE